MAYLCSFYPISGYLGFCRAWVRCGIIFLLGSHLEDFAFSFSTIVVGSRLQSLISFLLSVLDHQGLDCLSFLSLSPIDKISENNKIGDLYRLILSLLSLDAWMPGQPLTYEFRMGKARQIIGTSTSRIEAQVEVTQYALI